MSEFWWSGSTADWISALWWHTELWKGNKIFAAVCISEGSWSWFWNWASLDPGHLGLLSPDPGHPRTLALSWALDSHPECIATVLRHSDFPAWTLRNMHLVWTPWRLEQHTLAEGSRLLAQRCPGEQLSSEGKQPGLCEDRQGLFVSWMNFVTGCASTIDVSKYLFNSSEDLPEMLFTVSLIYFIMFNV